MRDCKRHHHIKTNATLTVCKDNVYSIDHTEARNSIQQKASMTSIAQRG